MSGSQPFTDTLNYKKIALGLASKGHTKVIDLDSVFEILKGMGDAQLFQWAIAKKEESEGDFTLQIVFYLKDVS